MNCPTEKVDQLRTLIAQLKKVLVCFSGGVDSSYLLAEAVAVLGKDAVAFTAVSPSLAREEKTAAERLAHQLGAAHIVVETHELDDVRYASNPVNRCYFCKTEVYGVARESAQRLGISHVIDGFNRDDRADHRPGRRAAVEKQVRSPLDEVGFSKSEIREAAKQIGLPVWNKPALACLSSRFPYETKITPDRLMQVAECERTLRELGFHSCRVRYHDAIARIELQPEEIPRVVMPEVRQRILERFRAAGFTYITVDIEGYRSGSMNVSTATKRTFEQMEYRHEDW